MKRPILLYMMLAAAPLSGFAQETASAPLAGKLLITGSSTMAPMVELHGGTIEVESEAGKGSTFTLRVPVQEKS